MDEDAAGRGNAGVVGTSRGVDQGLALGMGVRGGERGAWLEGAKGVGIGRRTTKGCAWEAGGVVQGRGKRGPIWVLVYMLHGNVRLPV